MTEIGEKITVAAVFNNGSVMPKKFFWNGKELKIEKIFLNYSKNSESSILKFFSVGIFSEDGIYELSFNTNSMIWRLEHVDSSH